MPVTTKQYYESNKKHIWAVFVLLISVHTWLAQANIFESFIELCVLLFGLFLLRKINLWHMAIANKKDYGWVLWLEEPTANSIERYYLYKCLEYTHKHGASPSLYGLINHILYGNNDESDVDWTIRIFKNLVWAMLVALAMTAAVVLATSILLRDIGLGIIAIGVVIYFLMREDKHDKNIREGKEEAITKISNAKGEDILVNLLNDRYVIPKIYWLCEHRAGWTKQLQKSLNCQ